MFTLQSMCYLPKHSNNVCGRDSMLLLDRVVINAMAVDLKFILVICLKYIRSYMTL